MQVPNKSSDSIPSTSYSTVDSAPIQSFSPPKYYAFDSVPPSYESASSFGGYNNSSDKGIAEHQSTAATSLQAPEIRPASASLDYSECASSWDESTIATNNNSTINYDRSIARKAKQMEQRSTIIMEMLQSERDYCHDLKVCANTFINDVWMKHQLINKGINISSIFRNLEEVIVVSEKLTTSLEERNLCRRPENQLIGCCFLNVLEDLRQAYSVYCRDHEEVPVAWKKAEDNPEVRQLLRQGFERIKAETNCFDVPSLLIKPVQRILKYPLLLNEITKCTEESHPDREDSIKAANAITHLAQEINEKKRQKDLVVKYKKDSNYQSLSSKISRINFHSMRKKSSRLQSRLSSSFGFSSFSKDEKFEEEHEKFKVLDKTIKIFCKNLNAYIQSSQEFVDTFFQFSEDIAAFYAEKCKQPELEEFRTAQRLLKTEYFEDFKKLLNSKVINVLQQLLGKFHNPCKLIEKRNDKLLDYETSNRKMESNKDQTRFRALKEEENIAKHNYEALNTQLLAELPVFTSTSVDILRNCIGAFMRIKRSFLAKITTEMLKLLDLPAFLGSPAINSDLIFETFQVKYNLIVDQMVSDFSLIPNGLFPDTQTDSGSLFAIGSLDRKEVGRKSRSSIGSAAGVLLKKANPTVQDQSHRVDLEKKYHGHLCCVTRDYETAELNSISVHKGDIVGVIKYKDPSGNPHLWFVDNGIDQGLLPESVLTPIKGNQALSHSDDFCPVLSSTLLPSSWNSYSQDSLPIVRVAPPIPTIAQYNKTSDAPMLDNSVLSMPPPLPPRVSSVSHSNYYTNIDSVPEEPNDYLPPRYDEVSKDQCATARELEQNLLLFDGERKGNTANSTESSDHSQRYLNIDEFDPLSSSTPANSNSATNSTSELNSGDIDESFVEPGPLILQNYQAAYDFSAQGPHQLSMSKGELVLVKYGCDLNGNTEWWFVRNRLNQEGYVPSNYLSPTQ